VFKVIDNSVLLHKGDISMSLDEKKKFLIEEFGQFSDWMDKYNYLIDIGKSLPLIDEKYKTEQYLIKGCQSQVWLHANYEDGRVYFTADSDAIITKGIVHALLKVLSGEKPDSIINESMGFIDEIGLKEHLSPTRANGLVSMIKQMKLFAMAFKIKYKD
jgi:cysteine desulfuration protein SufE